MKNRSSCQDVAMGSQVRRSKVLTEQEEKVVLAFRKLTQLPLDDCLYSLQETIPHVALSTLHGCFQRHGFPKLEKVETNKKVAEKQFKAYPIGYFHFRRLWANFLSLLHFLVFFLFFAAILAFYAIFSSKFLFLIRNNHLYYKQMDSIAF